MLDLAENSAPDPEVSGGRRDPHALDLTDVAAGDLQSAAADRFETEVNAQTAKARSAAQRRQQLVDAVEGQAYLDQMRRGRPSAIEVLDELTRRLPDTTYLEKVAIENDKLTVIGLSNEASSLVGRLEGSPLWRAPALTGALQPDPRSGKDRFTSTAWAVTTSFSSPVCSTMIQSFTPRLLPPAATTSRTATSPPPSHYATLARGGR